VSRIVLHPTLETREMTLARWLGSVLIGAGIATARIRPPVFEHRAGH
jgi:hypothetical protein